MLEPVIADVAALGNAVSGPHPGDTVFVKAVAGQFDAVVAVFHDQGHIPVKLRSAQGNGCPPVVVEADGLPGGEVKVRGAVSSQFVSALLLAAPRARGG